MNTSTIVTGTSREHALAGYVVLDADLERDCDAAVGVWDDTIGWAGRLPEMYAAFYLDCPLGRPWLKLLRHEASGTIVGTMGIGPRRILWRGREIRAGVTSHLAMMPAHRSVKPGIFLARTLVGAAGAHFDVVYGLPSRQGAALARLSGYKVGGELIRHVKVLRYQSYLERHVPRFAAAIGGRLINLAARAGDMLRRMREPASPHYEWVDKVDPRMEQLWQHSPHGDRWTTIRDTATLRWRFDRLPSVRRRYLLLGAVRGGELSAWFACDTHVRDRNMLTINDFWTEHGVHTIDPIAIRTLCRAAYREGFHAIELRFTGADAVHAGWAAAGFVERSRQPMIVIWQNAAMAGDLTGNLHITDIENDG